jgi:hypothetical protein
MFTTRKLREVQTVPATEVEHSFVTIEPGEIEGSRCAPDEGLLEAIDRLASGEVRVGRVLDPGEVLPADQPVGHSSQTTLP